MARRRLRESVARLASFARLVFAVNYQRMRTTRVRLALLREALRRRVLRARMRRAGRRVQGLLLMAAAKDRTE